ncbi:MAG: N-acetylornithine carbamoyltransferase [Planctomycetota bacterium]
MTTDPSLRHLLSLRDLDAADFDALLRDAEVLAGPRGRQPLLAGRRLGMLFFQPSLRTRLAFEIACFDLGAHAVHLQVGKGLWRLEHRDHVVMDGDAAEHVREGVGVLGRMLDGFGVRSFAGLVDAAEDARDVVLAAIVRASTVPVLSLESAMGHPHQGLADALTVRRRYPGQRVKVVLTWTPHVKPLPLAVPHTALLAFAREGHEVVLARPEGFDLDEGVVADACRLAVDAGGSITVTADRDAALEGAKVVYAKSWGSRGFYGDEAAGCEAIRFHRDWIVDRGTLEATDAAVLLHCLPVRRGLVVADEVLDGEASVVLDQAAARLDVQKATLCRAFGVEIPS